MLSRWQPKRGFSGGAAARWSYQTRYVWIPMHERETEYGFPESEA